jgi:hypothetical protein
MNTAVKIGISIMLVFPIFLSFANLDALSPQEKELAKESVNRSRSNITKSPPTPALNATQAVLGPLLYSELKSAIR